MMKPQCFNKTKSFVLEPAKVVMAENIPLEILNTWCDLCDITVESNSKIMLTAISENSCRLRYIEKIRRLTDEKYILNIEKTDDKVKVTIYYSGNKSLLYALCGVAKMLSDGIMYEGEVVDYPLFKVRGYIEGFYGKPWTQESRFSVLKLMAKYKMNTIYYAPKDDAFHRDLWRELYPENELNQLKSMVDLAKNCQMDFYYCIAPGLSMKYSDDDEFSFLIKKTEQLYKIGIRSFGLLLDDIPEQLIFGEDKEKYLETVNAHIDLTEKYFSALRGIDNCNKLTVCPTIYHGKGDEYYISKLGKEISPEIAVFWTGRDICSREITSAEAIKFIDNTSHKPLYWDNFPVNDVAMYNEMHLGCIVGRDADLYKYSEGIISNCMEYAECSKIPLMTFADYLWNSEEYESRKSWYEALTEMLGEDAQYFATFADHLFTSCLLDENSVLFMQALSGEGGLSGGMEAVISRISKHLEKMNICNELLKKDLPLYNELTKWSNKFSMACDVLNKLIETAITQSEDDIKELFELIERYECNPAVLTRFNLKGEIEKFFTRF